MCVIPGPFYLPPPNANSQTHGPLVPLNHQSFQLYIVMSASAVLEITGAEFSVFQFRQAFCDAQVHPCHTPTNPIAPFASRRFPFPSFAQPVLSDAVANLFRVTPSFPQFLLLFSLVRCRTHAQSQRHYETAAAADGQPMWFFKLKEGLSPAMTHFMTIGGPWDMCATDCCCAVHTPYDL